MKKSEFILYKNDSMNYLLYSPELILYWGNLIQNNLISNVLRIKFPIDLNTQQTDNKEDASIKKKKKKKKQRGLREFFL